MAEAPRIEGPLGPAGRQTHWLGVRLRDRRNRMAGLHKSGDSDVRASDHDRNEVAALLRVHCVEGRITFEELERRVERAMSAPTIGQLAKVLSDLPAVE